MACDNNNLGIPNAFQSYLRSIGEYPRITLQEEQQLAKLAQAGNIDAKNKLVTSNMRLVVAIAVKYVKYVRCKNVALLDLISAGNTGLMRAAEKYSNKRAKFSTYAAYWIKNYIRRCTYERRHGDIRLPIHVCDKLYGNGHKSKSFLKSIPTLPRNQVSIHDKVMNRYDDEMTLGDIIPDENAVKSDEVLENNDVARLLKRALKRLSKRDRTILQMRFGMGKYERMTLEEVGAIYGITRERVRQLQRDALAELKSTIRNDAVDEGIFLKRILQDKNESLKL